MSDPGRHRAPDDDPDDADTGAVNDDETDSGVLRPAQLDSDEGEPDITPFAGDDKTLEPTPEENNEPGYGYQ